MACVVGGSRCCVIALSILKPSFVLNEGYRMRGRLKSSIGDESLLETLPLLVLRGF